MIVVPVITSRGARRVIISAESSSLTSTIVSTGVSRFLVHFRFQRALVTACMIFASRTFIFSDNFIMNLHSMVRRCTCCYTLNVEDLPSHCLSQSITVFSDSYFSSGSALKNA